MSVLLLAVACDWHRMFQKAMRDREGKAIVNAHILGFLRRISKLLYYGIKPVFVFDGGVPTLKRQTINERKKRKRGVQDNLAKTAEKLLAAQLRQVAVMEAQKRSQVKSSTGDLITNDTVYFEHPIAQDFAEKNTVRKKRHSDPTDPATSPVPSPSKKPRFVPKDQYQLPPIDKIPSVTENEADHRLATETELKQFIQEFTPEDLDINSPHFQSLSTELKYEIIGDLRVKSRQPNRTRVEAMRKTNDLEFSQTQILNLKKRNDLTQKLLTVTDMVAKANLTIPVKIAAQRNKEYVLVKASEGWILGIENDDTNQMGSAKNPVKIEGGSDDEDVEFEEVKIDGPSTASDSSDEVEFEEVNLPVSASKPKPSRQQQEADWRAAIRFHYGTQDADSAVTVEDTHAPEPKDGVNLFRPSNEEDEVMRDIISELDTHEHSSQAGPSHDLGEGSSKAAAVTMTVRNLKPNEIPRQASSTSVNLPSLTEPQPTMTSKEAIDEMLKSVELEVDDAFLFPSSTVLNISQENSPDPFPHVPSSHAPENIPILESDKVAQQHEEISPEESDPSPHTSLLPISSTSPRRADVCDIQVAHPEQDKSSYLHSNTKLSTTTSTSTTATEHPETHAKERHSINYIAHPSASPNLDNISSSSSPQTLQPLPSESVDHIPDSPSKHYTAGKSSNNPVTTIDQNSQDAPSTYPTVHASNTSEPATGQDEAVEIDMDSHKPRSESPEISIPWSRTPTPERSMEKEAEQGVGSDEEEFDRVIEAEEQTMDENLALEANEWERFLAGLEEQEKKLEGMREETDMEVARLKEQKAKDRRDADDVTVQMSLDIQGLLTLFGIPFVVSPMEAEAQCAELLKLGLVDGVITDDSDVFLFGGDHVYKNLFNQNKFVECYLMKDLNHELGLDQHKLIQLAFLLGSDYTPGLNGVGPVTAMEILSEFLPPSNHTPPNPSQPDLSGLNHFKKWWQKVQVGKDTEAESRSSSFKKKFRKKKDKIWIDEGWPNPAVAEAYLHPTVDNSTEKFVWGVPDLEGIREFLYDHLSWSSIKTDELIIPLIKRQTHRLNGTLQTQGVLDDFFEYSVESNHKNSSARLAASRINGAFSSQRLQKIVQNWRLKKQVAVEGRNEDERGGAEEKEEEEGGVERSKKGWETGGGGRTKKRNGAARLATTRPAKRAPTKHSGRKKGLSKQPAPLDHHPPPKPPKPARKQIQEPLPSSSRTCVAANTRSSTNRLPPPPHCPNPPPSPSDLDQLSSFSDALESLSGTDDDDFHDRLEKK
ncbi:hypothetical protein VP01_237g12 [Puccinia sorghi]|uniref:DNA excision repair protein ERCC-5 n=1 Tax=Puccinia sorghi TaxID=27349 RepID=A0A0L6V8V1_9BASI|nr:hypothetical protein VP01_237g12 [Puccinia sorghi]